MADTHRTPAGPASRRTVVAAAGAAGLTAALAACGATEEPTVRSADPAAPEQPRAGRAPAPAKSPAGGGTGTKLAKTSDIPEGGGKIFEDRGVVVTQPAAGRYKAFSSACTHQGCAVTDVADGTINCACHGSRFRIEDGSVSAGPATEPLEPAGKVTVEGDSVVIS
ncbi:Rieske (2Fe-2S) protein [Streptomyces sp. NPDC059506]|uniref:Rieske (2Fe-2S) protein n=1 Tax=unclassified Streptomyces TaxID=2593676 RepID=UPI0015F8BDB8|nr:MULTISPECIES: Rieske (2Fe-2S) protein [unclassified Streptomyces]MCZ2527356.1 Rieske (2Fe-2S) protein [Streptomyces sp. HB2AG]QMV20750.1 Rieske 2Fe-2S domain-containing protein [Streptomyces sp. SCUT-3]